MKAKKVIDAIILFALVVMFAISLFKFENPAEIYDGYKHGFRLVVYLLLTTIFLNSDNNNNKAKTS